MYNYLVDNGFKSVDLIREHIASTYGQVGFIFRVLFMDNDEIRVDTGMYGPIHLRFKCEPEKNFFRREYCSDIIGYSVIDAGFRELETYRINALMGCYLYNYDELKKYLPEELYLITIQYLITFGESNGEKYICLGNAYIESPDFAN